MAKIDTLAWPVAPVPGFSLDTSFITHVATTNPSQLLVLESIAKLPKGKQVMSMCALTALLPDIGLDATTPPFPFLVRADSMFDTSFTGIGTDSYPVAHAYALGACAAQYFNDATRQPFGTRPMVTALSKCARCLVLSRKSHAISPDVTSVPIALSPAFNTMVLCILQLTLFRIKMKPPATITAHNMLVLISMLNDILASLRNVPKKYTSWATKLDRWICMEIHWYYGLYMLAEKRIPFQSTVVATDSCADMAQHLRACRSCFIAAGPRATQSLATVNRTLEAGYDSEPHTHINIHPTDTCCLQHTTLHTPFADIAKFDDAVLSDVVDPTLYASLTVKS
jgi:hypothetical protein